jgi:hypothetical protein
LGDSWMRVEGRHVRCTPLMMQLSPHASLLGCDRPLRNRTMCIEFSAQPFGRGALARSGFLGGARQALEGAPAQRGRCLPHHTGRAGTGSSGPVTTSRNACGRLGSTSNDLGPKPTLNPHRGPLRRRRRSRSRGGPPRRGCASLSIGDSAKPTLSANAQHEASRIN